MEKIILSPKAAERYNKMLSDLKKGKNFKVVKSVKELMADLHSDLPKANC